LVFKKYSILICKLNKLIIVLAATVLGMSIAIILDLITSAGTVWYKDLGSCISSIISSLFSAFAWVTVIFAVFERKGVNFTKLNQEWEPSSLPATPARDISIPILGPILSIIVSVLGVVILVFAPQLLGAYSLSDTTKVIPIFDLEVLKSVLPLFIIIFGLSIIKSIWEIIERRITIRYAVTTAIINLINL